MADLVQITMDLGAPALMEETLKEIGSLELASEDKMAKEVSKFLIRLAHQNQRDLIKYLPLFSSLLDSEVLPLLMHRPSHHHVQSYQVRCAMMEVMGYLMGKYLIFEINDHAMNQALTLCLALEERVLDVSSYCRARALKTLCYLCDISMDETALQQGLARKNAIPLPRRHHVVEAAIARLKDKASLVRKEALRLLSKIVETHPFWLDGGVLDLGLFRNTCRLIEQQLSTVSAADDFIAELEKALPAQAQEQLKKDREAKQQHEAATADAPKQAGDVPQQPKLSDEEIQSLRKRQMYYRDAQRFVEQINGSIPMVCQLLASKTKSDVVESIQFFVEAYRHGVTRAQDGIKRMVHLIWSKDMGDSESKSIKEYLVNAYQQLYIDVAAENEKDAVRSIVRNLITLTFNSTLADLTSLEQLLAVMKAKDLIPDQVEQHLWSVYGTTKQAIPTEQRRGAIIVLGMLAKETRQVVADRVPLLMKIGLGDYGVHDPLLARYTCIALQKLGPVKKMKGVAPDESYRFTTHHALFKKFKEVLVRPSASMDWFGMAEQAIATIYVLADQPDRICSSLIKHLTRRAFIQTSTEADIKVPKVSTNAFDMAKLLFVVGHVAVKQIAHMEKVEYELKNRKPVEKAAASKKTLAEEDADDLDQVVGSCEDDIGETVAYIREEELLYGDEAILSTFGPLVIRICSEPQSFPNPILQRMAVLALCKFMCVSEKFCDTNLQLLFTILEKSSDATSRSNIIIALGDMVVCFNNLIDQNISYLYNRLHDSDRTVKKNALMVLTHLILNGMVKVKGQISEMAKCMEDQDVRISDLARLFFSELATKDNAIYNNLPDIISNLSSKGDEVDENQYKSIMRYLFGFIEKDRQTENIVEKLCQRFRNASTPRQFRDIAFCLALLPYTSEKSVKKLAEGLSFYQDKLYEETVYKHFCDIMGKAKKFQKLEVKQFVDEFEKRLVELHEKGVSDERVSAHAGQASSQAAQLPVSSKRAVGTPRRASRKADETAKALSGLSIKSPKPAPVPAKKRTSRKPKHVVSSDEEEEDESEDVMDEDKMYDIDEADEQEDEQPVPTRSSRKQSTAAIDENENPNPTSRASARRSTRARR